MIFMRSCFRPCMALLACTSTRMLLLWIVLLGAAGLQMLTGR